MTSCTINKGNDAHARRVEICLLDLPGKTFIHVAKQRQKAPKKGNVCGGGPIKTGMHKKLFVRDLFGKRGKKCTRIGFN